MSFYNNQLDFMNVNSNFQVQSQNSAQSSGSSNTRELPNRVVDVRYSTLEPTAQEFHPSSQTSGSTNGAVKKTPQNEKNQYKSKEKNRRSWYGSGRTFNGSKRDHYNRNERSYKNEEQSNFQDNTSIVGKSNQNSCIDDVLSYNSYNSDKFTKEKKNLNNPQLKNLERNVDAASKQYGSRNKYKENTKTDYPTSSLDSSQSYENYHKNFKGNSRTYEKSYKSNFHNKYDNNYYEKSDRNNTYDKYSRSDNYYDGSGKSYTNNHYRKNSNNSFERSNIDLLESDSYRTQRNEFHNSEFKSGFKPYNNKSDKYVEGKTRKDWRVTNSNKHSKDSTTKLNKKCKYLKHSSRVCNLKFFL